MSKVKELTVYINTARDDEHPKRVDPVLNIALSKAILQLIGLCQVSYLFEFLMQVLNILTQK